MRCGLRELRELSHVQSDASVFLTGRDLAQEASCTHAQRQDGSPCGAGFFRVGAGKGCRPVTSAVVGHERKTLTSVAA